MKLKSVREAHISKGTRVLLRVDFNVPLAPSGAVESHGDYRIRESLETIKFLRKKGARIIIVAHLGRPNGKVVESLRLDPIAVRLAQLLKVAVYKTNEIVGANVEAAVDDLKPGEILLLENVRFDAHEEKADAQFAHSLAVLADVYVNDAFGVSHRKQASVTRVTRYLPSYAGLLLEREVRELSPLIEKKLPKLVVIIGGAKISTKVGLIKQFLPRAEHILLGGALANTVLQAQGVSVGASLVEPEMVSVVKKICLTNPQLHVPVDGVMATSDHAKGHLDALGDIKPKEKILDIGPDTVKLYNSILKAAKTVIWNGPMGLIEQPQFSRGTEQLAKLLSRSNAKVIIGGGETVEVIRRMKLEKKFHFISTGGGAMLEFLEEGMLPGVERLLKE